MTSEEQGRGPEAVTGPQLLLMLLMLSARGRLTERGSPPWPAGARTRAALGSVHQASKLGGLPELAVAE